MNKQVLIDNINVESKIVLFLLPDTILVECLELVNEELWSLEEDPKYLLNIPKDFLEAYQVYMSNELLSHTAPSVIYRHPESCNDYTSALFIRLDYFLLLSFHNLSKVFLHLLPELERNLSQASYPLTSDPQKLINLFHQMTLNLIQPC